jgi:hypothetical protein
MAIAVTSIGTGQSKSTTATSTTATWAVNDFVIVVTSSRSTLTSVTLAGAGSGGASLSLTKDKENANGTSLYGAIWRGKVLTAVGTATGVVITNAASTAKACTVYKVTGIQDSPLDKNAGATGSSTSPSSGATAALAQADELVIGSVATLGPSGDTAGTWTTGTSNVSGNEQRLGTTGSTSTTNATASSAAEIVSATTAQTAAKTSITSRAWAASIVTYLGVADTVPADPTSAHTDSKTAISIVMHWTDNATNETDYHMFKNDVDIAQIAAGSVSYEFTGLSPSTQYDLAVKAHNAAGYSAEAQLTETTNALPATPTSAHTDSKTDVQIVMHWTDNATDETGYKMYKDTVYIETIAAGSVSYTFTTLSGSTQYTLEVCATNANGDSTKAQLIETTNAPVGGTLYETCPTENGYAEDLFLDSNVAQSFTPEFTHTIYSLKVKLQKFTSPTGNIQAFIYATSGGLPTGAALCASGTLDASTVSTSKTEYTFTFSTNPSLTGGTQYMFVLTCTGGNESNYIYVYSNYNSSVDPYAGGEVRSWIYYFAANYTDMYFIEYDSADTVYESYTYIGSYVGSVYLDRECVQTFAPVTAHSIAKVRLNIRKTGSPTGTYKIAIKATDASGHPTGSDLCSITGDASVLTTTFTLTTFTFTASAALSATVLYAIVISISGGSSNASNCVYLSSNYNSTTDGYVRGKSGSGGWVSSAAYSDLYFKEFGEPSGSAPNAPSDAHLDVRTTSTITMHWTDNSTDETGFKIYKNDIFVTNVAAGTVSYQFTGLLPNTVYDLAVKSKNIYAASAEAQLTATTLHLFIVNIGDAFKNVDTDVVKINIGDVWKSVVGMYVNISDAWKTIFRMFFATSTPTEGYVISGYGSAAYKTKVENLLYSNETCAALATAISAAEDKKYSAVGLASSERGYNAGGNTSVGYVHSIFGIIFSNETYFSNGSQLTVERAYAWGFSSNNKGYIEAGTTDIGNTANIDRMRFDTEVVALIAATLAEVQILETGVGSTTKGYGLGNANKIDILTYSDETESRSANVLSLNVNSADGVSSTTKGYITGGNYLGYVDDIHGITFSTDTAFAGVALLSTNKEGTADCNSGTKGYICGGETAASTQTAVIEALTYSGETRATLSAVLSEVNANGAGIENGGIAMP